MPQMSFELQARQKIGTGECWYFRCSKCGFETSTIISYRHPLEKDSELKCPCGVKDTLFTSHPRFGKDLLDAIKNAPPPPDDLLKRHPPSPN